MGYATTTPWVIVLNQIVDKKLNILPACEILI